VASAVGLGRLGLDYGRDIAGQVQMSFSTEVQQQVRTPTWLKLVRTFGVVVDAREGFAVRSLWRRASLPCGDEAFVTQDRDGVVDDHPGNPIALGEKPAEPLPRAARLPHIHATTLLLAGVAVHVVAAWLGHVDPAIMLRVCAHMINTARRGGRHLREADQRRRVEGRC
jgi:hypothetical protein